VRDIQGVEFAQEIEALLKLYPREVTEVQLNLLDSHDTARFVTVAGNDVDALALATLFQMVYPGAPCIYYGDEIGLSGGKDPESRASFPWHAGGWHSELRDYFKKAVALRHAHPALRRGDYHTLYGEGTVYALGRGLGEDRILAAFNAGTSPQEVVLPVGEFVPDGAVLSNVWGSDTYTVSAGRIGIRLPSQSALVLEAAT
jgi:glycosidase